MDGISENQLSVAVNVEVDHATGRLRTVAGTVDILRFENIFAALYDEINQKLLIVRTDKKVFAVDIVTLEIGDSLGTLSGELYPFPASWENGALIASGGKLIGMINLSSYVLLIKNNRRIYRLSGEYPNWQISEVSRNVE